MERSARAVCAEMTRRDSGAAAAPPFRSAELAVPSVPPVPSVDVSPPTSACAGRVHPNEVIWCENGSIVVARHRFKEDRLPYGNLTFTEVLAKSSNVGAIKVAQRLRPEEFIDYIRGFGFGRKTGIDLPGESPGFPTIAEKAHRHSPGANSRAFAGVFDERCRRNKRGI